MLVTLNNNVDRRLQSWCKYTHLSPEVFIIDVAQRSLDDWEDYNDAISICSEIDAGRMKTYSLADVEAHLDTLEGEITMPDTTSYSLFSASFNFARNAVIASFTLGSSAYSFIKNIDNRLPNICKRFEILHNSFTINVSMSVSSHLF